MAFFSPTLPRLFTHEESIAFLSECQAFTQEEFGSEDAFQVDYLIRHREQGVQFYQPYGDFSANPPKVIGLASCMFISYQMYDDMLAGLRKETELEPWRPEDGKAIFWIAAVVSDQPGVLAKCLSEVFDQAEKHPYIDRVDRVGVVCTGPQGYLMSRAAGLVERENRYKGSWLFMDRELGSEGFPAISRHLYEIWSMTRARDCIRQGRAIWGDNWREGELSKPSVLLAQSHDRRFLKQDPSPE